MKIIRLFIVMFSCAIAISIKAQGPLRINAGDLIKGITLLPPTVEELHSAFTVHTKFGEEFQLSTRTDLPFARFKQLVCAIHDSAIRAIMKKAPRRDMADSIQYEDERWKLALRPLLGADVKARLLKLDAAVKPFVLQIFEMQNIFDWVAYYSEEEQIKKSFREKQAAITTESTTATAKAKSKLDELQYKTQQQLWMKRYSNYSQALLSLQQLMEKIDYGATLHGEDKRIVMRVLADVQARALEAHEKLIWNEMSVAISGELVYNGKRIVSMYSE